MRLDLGALISVSALLGGSLLFTACMNPDLFGYSVDACGLAHDVAQSCPSVAPINCQVIRDAYSTGRESPCMAEIDTLRACGEETPDCQPAGAEMVPGNASGCCNRCSAQLSALAACLDLAKRTMTPKETPATTTGDEVPKSRGQGSSGDFAPGPPPTHFATPSEFRTPAGR